VDGLAKIEANGSKGGTWRRRRDAAPIFPRLATILAAGIGATLLIDAGWIHAKAELASLLLGAAFERAVLGETDARPWPWADTKPVAKLDLPRQNAPVFVLAGASGQSLAFGAGRMIGGHGPDPASEHVVLAGHRDTHFRALAELEEHDVIVLTRPGGPPRSYRVVSLRVIDEADRSWLDPFVSGRLSLLTCYPFDGIDPNGRLRFLVTAELVLDGTP